MTDALTLPFPTGPMVRRPVRALSIGEPRRLPIDPTPMVRATDPATSRAAARRVADPANLSAAQGATLRALASIRCGTDSAIAQAGGIHLPTVSKRTAELERGGLLEQAGEGMSGQKCRARTWTLTDLGRTVADALLREER